MHRITTKLILANAATAAVPHHSQWLLPCCCWFCTTHTPVKLSRELKANPYAKVLTHFPFSLKLSVVLSISNVETRGLRPKPHPAWHCTLCDCLFELKNQSTHVVQSSSVTSYRCQSSGKQILVTRLRFKGKHHGTPPSCTSLPVQLEAPGHPCEFRGAGKAPETTKTHWAHSLAYSHNVAWRCAENASYSHVLVLLRLVYRIGSDRGSVPGKSTPMT